MSDGKYSLETFHRVYNDKHGDYIQVGPSADGLDGITEIKSVDRRGEEMARLSILDEQIPLLITALEKYLKDKM